MLVRMARRVRIASPGGWDHLTIETFTCPKPGPDEIQIDVAAIGINFADIAVRQGLYSSAKKFVGWPITPGFEVSGVVSAVGAQAKNSFKPGDRVLAATFFGGYSSRVTVGAAYARRIPGHLGFAEAAGIPAVFTTAYYAVNWLARVHPGSRALVHSAAGGVGLALIQLLKAQGCQVVGVVGSGAKTATARRYGADAVIDKSTQEWWTGAERASPAGFDLIFDPNGLSTLRQSYEHLAPGGLLFIYGFQSMLSGARGRQNPLALAQGYVRTPRFNPFDMVKTNRSIMAFNISYLYDRADILREAFDYIVSGFTGKHFMTLPTKTYPFQEVAKAHQDIESGKTTGKLILTI